MKKITLLLLAVILILALPGCKKILDTSVPDLDQPTQPTPTAVGDPIGAVVSKTIGKTGGSIVSADSTTELIFPAGALDDNTDISVQATTNTAPNGVGNSYSFLPDGIQFKQPVTLKFHYTADDLASTLGDLMGIAFQDHSGIWYRVNDFTNDTINKIISAPIKHFTPYTKFDVLIINPVFANVKVNKSIDLRVDVVSSDDDDLAKLGPQGDEDLAPLIKLNSKKVVWSVNGVVNGSATSGTVTGSSLEASFKAPAKAPSQNPVAVSALVDAKFKYHGKTFDKTSLVSNIQIIDGEKYLLQIYLHQQAGEVLYTDSASMTVTVTSDETVTISDIKNYAPNSTPAVVTSGGCTYTYLPEGIGEMNIISGTGETTAPFGDPSRMLILQFTHSGAISPSSKVDCPGSDAYTDGGIANPGDPGDLSFALIPSDGTWTTDDGEVSALLTLENGVH